MKNSRHIASRRSRLGLILLCGLLMHSCGFPPREPSHVNTYLLSLDTMPEVAQTHVRKGTLLVAMPHARAGFDTPRMGYMLRPHELLYFATSQWADTPARMLAPLLALVLEHTGTWEAVAQMPTSVRGDYRVELDSLALRQEFFERPSRVRLQARVQLIDLQRQCVLRTRHFEVLETAPADDPYGGVLAANQAVASFLVDVASWLGRSHTLDAPC